MRQQKCDLVTFQSIGTRPSQFCHLLLTARWWRQLLHATSILPRKHVLKLFRVGPGPACNRLWVDIGLTKIDPWSIQSRHRVDRGSTSSRAWSRSWIDSQSILDRRPIYLGSTSSRLWVHLQSIMTVDHGCLVGRYVTR